MIKVRQIANRSIQIINQDIPAVLKKPEQYSTNDAGRRENDWTERDVVIQSQPVSSKEYQLAETLNITGVLRAVHINGNIQGLRRYCGKGSDVLRFKQFNEACPRDWLIVEVMESWPDWCRVLLCQQL